MNYESRRLAAFAVFAAILGCDGRGTEAVELRPPFSRLTHHGGMTALGLLEEPRAHCDLSAFAPLEPGLSFDQVSRLLSTEGRPRSGDHAGETVVTYSVRGQEIDVVRERPESEPGEGRRYYLRHVLPSPTLPEIVCPVLGQLAPNLVLGDRLHIYAAQRSPASVAVGLDLRDGLVWRVSVLN